MEHHGTLQKPLFNATICQLIVYFTIGCSLFFSGNQAPADRKWISSGAELEDHHANTPNVWGKGVVLAFVSGKENWNCDDWDDWDNLLRISGRCTMTFHAKTGTWYILRRCNKILPEQGMYLDSSESWARNVVYMSEKVMKPRPVFWTVQDMGIRPTLWNIPYVTVCHDFGRFDSHFGMSFISISMSDASWLHENISWINCSN